MRKLLVVALVLGLAGLASAYDLGNQIPAKADISYPENIPNPDRQGGDTILNATLIPAVPYSDSGTTSGYVNNYDAVCPYTGSTAPDVVYKFTPATAMSLTIDLCYSSFDTKLYVWDANLNLIACNDDFYFAAPCYVYSSRLDNVLLNAGALYYIIIDGYGSAAGAYVMDIVPFVPCVVDCPAGGVPEGEPTLVNDYVDNYNGGCNTDPNWPFQTLTADGNGDLILCGKAGWYLYGGSQYRDTDWFYLTMGPGGSIEVTGDGEYGTYLFELGPQDCNAVGVIQSVDVGPCSEGYMTISGYAHGAIVWFWAGPDAFDPPSNPFEYDYVCWFSGLEPGVATQPATWGGVKALYE